VRERRTGCFERMRSRFVAAVGTTDRDRAIECEARLGRLVDQALSWRFFGPLPSRWGHLTGPPPFEHHIDVARAATRCLARRGGAAALYSACRSSRITIIDGVPGAERALDVWSTTVSLRLPDGGETRLGWSGSGDGLDEFAAIGDEIMSLQRSLAGARPLDSSTTSAILSAQAAAVLLHEAIGHPIEGGQQTRRSYIGRRIASERLTAFDDPSLKGAPGTYEYDDENVRSLGRTLVVNQGVVVAEVHSRESARQAGTLSTANGRAASAWQSPIPRLSNLICKGGDQSLEELIESAGDSLLFHRLSNGANTGAQIQISVILAERITRGRRTGQFVTGGRIEETPSIPLRIVGIGGRTEFSRNAMCGKAGQLLFNVGTCAPPIRLASLRCVA
jgi:TldD protein